ncbi:pca operon transcription factor PcaQ [Saccharospirillum sp.]|uniref:pca operon transcription factor PcaQ n=1 Tax=Saccharospirillum sp. TaxID=2033801 RepID=UPI0034A08500
MSTLHTPKSPIIDNRIKFRHLQCFIEVVRQGGVVRAASYLSLTQPAVSKKLRELEDMLGVELLNRQRKGVELTRFGEVFLRYALNSTDALREGIDRVSASSRAEHSPVVIGVLPTIATTVMPKALQAFKSKMPYADVTLLNSGNRMLLDALRMSELDLVVGRVGSPAQMQGLVFEQLYQERIAIVVRPDHPVLWQSLASLEVLSEYPILMPPPDSVIRSLVDQFMILNGIRPNANRIETISHAFGRAYVRDSDTVWLISHGAVQADICEGRLVELPYDFSTTLSPVGIATRVDGHPSEAQLVLMEQVRQVTQTLSAV